MFGRNKRKEAKKLHRAMHHRGMFKACKHCSRQSDETTPDVLTSSGELAGRARQAAERARGVAADAQRHATPIIKATASKSAEKLSEAAARAADVLAEAADRLAEEGSGRTTAATRAARHGLADTSEAFAEALRPKKKHWFRRIFLLGTVMAAIGSAAAMVWSPVGDRLRRWLYGEEIVVEESDSITLPASTNPTEVSSNSHKESDVTTSSAHKTQEVHSHKEHSDKHDAGGTETAHSTRRPTRKDGDSK